MGLSGYAGSPAHREDDREPKLGFRIWPLEHPLVRQHLEAARSLRGTIMLHPDCRRGRGHHYRLLGDDFAWYIRMGRRAAVPETLRDCEVTFIDGKPTLFAFRIN
jgi:hypothetical protein